MKSLNVIKTAYRATLEEQDDTIVWFTHAMKGAGADLDVLLRGAAVNYASTAQEVAPLRFGERAQKNAPQIAGDVAGLIAKGVSVYVVDEDLAERGVGDDVLVDGLNRIKRADMPRLFGRYEHIWAW